MPPSDTASSRKRKLQELAASLPPLPTSKGKAKAKRADAVAIGSGKGKQPAVKGEVAEDNSSESDSDSGSDSDSDSSDAPSHIDVSFTFVAPSSIDFHALKALLSQLLHTHAPTQPIGEIVDGILARGGVADVEGMDKEPIEGTAVGTVIKQDTGDEEDAQGEVYGVMSAFDLKTYKSPSNRLQRAATHLYNYIFKQIKSESPVRHLLVQPQNRTLVLLHERLINMPAAVAPVLYRLTLDELASSQKTKPTHVLLFSRAFPLSAVQEDAEHTWGSAKKGTKRRKQHVAVDPAAGESDIGLFKPEDLFFKKHCAAMAQWQFPAPPSAESWSEAPILGRFLVLTWDAFHLALKDIDEEFGEDAGGAFS